jgi:putative acetyltransferase
MNLPTPTVVATVRNMHSSPRPLRAFSCTLAVVNIRPERPADAAAIDAVNRAAFGQPAEATLVADLRDQASPLVSLVAEEGRELVGHVLFSPVTLTNHADVKIMGLAPMAVLPAMQRRGIGSALARAGLDACTRLGYDAVVVVGHAQYYPHFGFRPASAFGLRCEYDVPDDVFMALELAPGRLAGKSGTIRYHPAFAGL